MGRSPETQVEHHLGVLARTGVARPALEDALTTIVDAAIELTHAQQGVLLLAKSSGNLELTVARDAQRVSLPLHQVQISSSVLSRAMGSRRELIVTEAEPGPSFEHAIDPDAFRPLKLAVLQVRFVDHLGHLQNGFVAKANCLPSSIWIVAGRSSISTARLCVCLLARLP